MAMQKEKNTATKTVATAESPDTAAKEKQKAYQSCYTVGELAAASNAFGTSQIVVNAALGKDGQPEYTMEQAKTIVKAFLSKEVK